jgi:drug/metabolite transporter (DMT)-like permease
MALWLAVTKRSLLRLPWRTLLTILGVGALIGAHWTCFFWSISLSNISVALAGFATISLFTAFTEPLIEGRPFRRSELLCGGIVIVGILFIAGHLDPQHLTGLGIALVGALLASLLLYEMIGASFVAALAIPFIEPHHFQLPTSADWLPLLTLAILCTAIAHTWNIHLLRRLTAYTANLTMNFEPVWGIILGAIIFHEYQDLQPAFYLGTILIVFANFLDPWLRRRQARPGLVNSSQL